MIFTHVVNSGTGQTLVKAIMEQEAAFDSILALYREAVLASEFDFQMDVGNNGANAHTVKQVLREVLSIFQYSQSEVEEASNPTFETKKNYLEGLGLDPSEYLTT